MKKIILLSIMLVITQLAFSADKSLRAYLSYATFTVPGGKSTIETYLAVDGNSVVFKKQQDENFRASIEITLLFKQGDTISSFSKYELLSPVTMDTSKIDFGFIDFQRYALADGEYDMEIQIADLNNPSELPFKTTETVQINYPVDKMSFSGIQFVDSYKKSENPSIITKNGLDIIPLVFNYYPESKSTLTFYSEIYNSASVLGKESMFLLSYSIQSFESNNRMKEFVFNKRLNTKDVNVVLNSIDISKLPSGNYLLVVEARDRENKLICSNEMFFQRSNPATQFNLDDLAGLEIDNTFASKITQTDTLREFLRTLEPLSTEIERDYAHNLIKTDDFVTMRQYLYNFWYKRDNGDPETAFKNYLFEVKKADKSFKTQTKRGYETDRGRVYLQYGAPYQIADSHNEPAAYPYEIWQYYQLGKQRNKRFVFCTQDIGTNDFILIHSDAFGELSNFHWQEDVYKRIWPYNNVDNFYKEDDWGSKATEYYNNPR
jgi:GWxTD domain-containing protein